ncbi:MAG: hypothetical protein DMG38_05215 [Acidobacteria bacterium]|nr:MAG: hypothetical protein DMG38_05215 [Acidobacteriota bacterium]
MFLKSAVAAARNNDGGSAASDFCANFPELRAEMHANALRRQNFPLAANDLSFSTAGFLLVARLLATSGGFRKRRAVRPGRVNSLVTSKRY